MPHTPSGSAAPGQNPNSDSQIAQPAGDTPELAGLKKDDVRKTPERLNIERQRIALGYFIGAASIVAIGALAWDTLSELQTMKVTDIDAGHERVYFALFGARAVIVVAIVWFCYQLIRLAERLALPFWWFENNIEIAKALLGVQDPFRAIMKFVKELTAVSSESVEKGVELAEKAQKIRSKAPSGEE